MKLYGYALAGLILLTIFLFMSIDFFFEPIKSWVIRNLATRRREKLLIKSLNRKLS